MKKLNEFFFVLISICTLFFVACRNDLSNNSSEGDNLSSNTAYIRVSIDEAVSEMVTRSVLPTFESDYIGFKKFDFTEQKMESLHQILTFPGQRMKLTLLILRQRLQ
ncbi:MAG: hypothetical protein K6A43_12255 [Treponema sp.]|nr:hypothetical protein [Treponema sp.]